MTESARPTAFAEALDTAVTQRGVTLTQLHRRLAELATPVSLAALSYWRSGRSEPERQTSLEAVRVLEELLGLAEGDLTGHLRPVRRPRPPTRLVPIQQLIGHEEAVTSALATLDFTTAHDELAEDAGVLTMDIDAEGRAHRVTALLRWRALRDDAQRAAFVFPLDGREAPVLTTKAGIRIGRSHLDTDRRIQVGELFLERPLGEGELAFGEYEVALDGAPYADGSLTYYATRRVSQMLVWARFHPDCLPVRCEAFDVIDGVEGTRSMSLDGGHTLHRQVGQFGPGTVGLRWFW